MTSVKPLAVQLFSVRQDMTDDPTETLRRLAAIGYGAVEPTMGLLQADPARFRATLDGLGLSVCSLHAPALGAMRDEIAVAAAAIGTDAVIVPSVPAGEFTDGAGVARVARQLRDAAAWAADNGLRLGYHNHHWELSQRVAGQPALELLADLLPAEVFLEVDVYWAAVGGADVVALLHRLGDRVRYLHVKDGPATVDDPMTAVGGGTLPIVDILRAGPPDAWHVVELDRCATDMMGALADSHAYLTEAAAAGAPR